MNILLVSATAAEIETTLNRLNYVGRDKKHVIEHLVTGVGMTATAYALGKHLATKSYDLLINAGIAGAFDRSLNMGEVVRVALDCFSELGAEDGEDFVPIDQLGFGRSSVKPSHSYNNAFTDSLKAVRSISVNRVHGNDESIYLTSSRLNPQTESMEGAAFFYACNQANVPCLQLRAISNYVERRNRANWNIELAIENLNDSLNQLITSLR